MVEWVHRFLSRQSTKERLLSLVTKAQATKSKLESHLQYRLNKSTNKQERIKSHNKSNNGEGSWYQGTQMACLTRGNGINTQLPVANGMANGMSQVASHKSQVTSHKSQVIIQVKQVKYTFHPKKSSKTGLRTHLCKLTTNTKASDYLSEGRQSPQPSKHGIHMSNIQT